MIFTLTERSERQGSAGLQLLAVKKALNAFRLMLLLISAGVARLFKNGLAFRKRAPAG